MRSGRTQEAINNLAHRHYVTWAVGDGATTEFKLGKSVRRLEDLQVTKAGAVQRPSAGGTPFDYAVRGVTPGYAGDANFVRFTVAPVVGADLGFFQTAD